MSDPIEPTENDCLCQDCGGINQMNANDLRRHYDRETGDIVYICLDCHWNRIAPVDPEESAFYRYGQH